MPNVAVLSTLILGLATGGAFAQIATSDTQTPSAPNASSQAVESANSLPSSAITSSQTRVGSDVATTRVGPAVSPVVGAPIR